MNTEKENIHKRGVMGALPPKTKQTRRKREVGKRLSRRSTPPFSPLLGMVGGAVTADDIRKFRKDLESVFDDEKENVEIKFINFSKVNSADLLSQLNTGIQYGSTILGLLIGTLRTNKHDKIKFIESNKNEESNIDIIKNMISDIINLGGIHINIKTSDGSSILDQTIIYEGNLEKDNSDGAIAANSFFNKIFIKSKGFEPFKKIISHIINTDEVKLSDRGNKFIKSVSELKDQNDNKTLKRTLLTYNESELNTTKFFEMIEMMFAYFNLDTRNCENIMNDIDLLQRYTNIIIIKKDNKFIYPFDSAIKMNNFIAYLTYCETPSSGINDIIAFLAGKFDSPISINTAFEKFISSHIKQGQDPTSGTLAVVAWIKLVQISQFRAEFIKKKQKKT